MKKLRRKLSGHWWTVVPFVRSQLRPALVHDEPWRVAVPGPGPDPAGEPIDLVGALGPKKEPGDARETLFLLVHGLGGSADSAYMLEAAATIASQGHAYLRISMRGAGASGPDFYHAGLWSDLAAILAAPSLSAYREIFVVGFSLGGHIALHLACAEERDPRIRGVVAVCSPLDLERNAWAVDSPSVWIYRRYIIRELERIYVAIGAGAARHFAGIRIWDRVVVAPRWGFADERDYWHSQSVGPRLVDAALPFLFIAAEGDPIIPVDTLRPHLERARAAQPERAEVVYVARGGHVGFPDSLDLGLEFSLPRAPAPGLMAQVVGWCESRLEHE